MRKTGEPGLVFRLWAAVVFAIALLGLSARPAERTAREKAQCLLCHTVGTLAASVHSALYCTDCHAVALLQGAHKPPHAKANEIPPVNCTALCHQENHFQRPGQSPIYYPDSVHGKAYLERGVPEVAKCWDCHGKHNIKAADDPESTVNRRNIPITCSICHDSMSVVLKYNIHAEHPYLEYIQSFHGKALFEKGLVSFAAVCTDCHGIHDIKGVGEPNLMARKPETCGRCHSLILDEYRENIHGREALKGNIDVPLCVDCHGEHTVSPFAEKQSPTSKKNIPDTCSTCHARPEIMKKYSVPPDRIRTFIESIHGIAIGFGDQAEAACTDCHGVHDIRPASDPSSHVYPANLARTCGQPNCHTGMPEKIASAKIHLDISQKKSGAPYYIQKIFLWSVVALAGFTLIWFIPALMRRSRLLKKK